MLGFSNLVKGDILLTFACIPKVTRGDSGNVHITYQFFRIFFPFFYPGKLIRKRKEKKRKKKPRGKKISCLAVVFCACVGGNFTN